MKTKAPDFRVVNSGESAVVYLYDVIGEDFFGGISAKMFADELAKLKSAKQIDVRINSPGGDVFAGNTMHNLLKQHRAKINTYVDGVAASIASIIAMAGDEIEIAPNAMFMVHEPSGLEYGTAQDHRKLADLLDKIRDTLVQTYVARTGGDEQTISDMVARETWLTAEESLELGFADRIGQGQAVAACIDPERFRYRNIPKALLESAQEPAPAVLSIEAAQEKINTIRARSAAK